MRKVRLENEEYYHIFNRGVDKREVFSDAKDYERFILSMFLMNDEQDGLMIEWRNFKASHKNASLKEFLRLNLREKRQLVKIVAYCLNPNHYHLILKQLREKGIEKFMQKVSTGYTMYFNEKTQRSGSLFQGRFKSTHIGSNELFLHLSVYVNFNSEIHGIATAKGYNWCSLSDYLGRRKSNIIKVDKSQILKQFNNIDQYLDFSVPLIKYFKDKKEDEMFAKVEP